MRKGTRMVVVAHHDNSANNPYNPDPTKEVVWVIVIAPLPARAPTLPFPLPTRRNVKEISVLW